MQQQVATRAEPQWPARTVKTAKSETEKAYLDAMGQCAKKLLSDDGYWLTIMFGLTSKPGTRNQNALRAYPEAMKALRTIADETRRNAAQTLSERALGKYLLTLEQGACHVAGESAVDYLGDDLPYHEAVARAVTRIGEVL